MPSDNRDKGLISLYISHKCCSSSCYGLLNYNYIYLHIYIEHSAIFSRTDVLDSEWSLKCTYIIIYYLPNWLIKLKHYVF